MQVTACTMPYMGLQMGVVREEWCDVPCLSLIESPGLELWTGESVVYAEKGWVWIHRAM